MASQPPPPDPIDPTVPDELPPVIAPDHDPASPTGVLEIAPDSDVPDSSPSELPEL
mgnify:CR=1 FL=1